ncbi:MAG: thiamine phosphate synthase [Planctomycetes bacterium]|nr:thiamine phosphate synthase [Planctomycetota bacterium]
MARAAERVTTDADERRARLERARLMLLFTPALCPTESEPLALLARVLPELDVVQVRIKAHALGTSPARELAEWTRRVLALVREQASPALVLVNDRVDVAAALAAEGVDGVHLGADDCPPALARAELGEAALIGLSTHSAADVVRAADEPVDYLGFGPVHPSATKGYTSGLGCEAAWIAARATLRPLFPIGGIELANAAELAPIGRAALSRAILCADDPLAAARELRALLAAE